jgi:hypothetical protein
MTVDKAYPLDVAFSCAPDCLPAELTPSLLSPPPHPRASIPNNNANTHALNRFIFFSVAARPARLGARQEKYIF